MNANRFVKSGVAEAALIFLLAAVAPIRAQSPAPVPMPPPEQPEPARQTAPPMRPMKQPGPMDDFAGLTYTNDQKAKIRQVHQDIKERMDTVIKDNKLSPEQKRAMLQGYQHMERGQVYKVLTVDQQKEVRKKALVRRAAAQKEQQQEKQRQESLQAPR